MPRTRSDFYIEVDPDGGYETIELWCYRQAEAEIEALKLKIHQLENKVIPDLKKLIPDLPKPKQFT